MANKESKIREFLIQIASGVRIPGGRVNAPATDDNGNSAGLITVTIASAEDAQSLLDAWADKAVEKKGTPNLRP
jgi:hypothetical protein